MIGPYRGGRTVGASGIAKQPNVFYIGVNNGGVWKTDDYGRTWNPVFDEQPTGSIGDVAVAPSNPEVVYAASGEGLQRPDLSVGNGVYRSADGGKTWHNTGLGDGQQIGGLCVDPKNENRVFAAVLGHPYGPNEQRGVFRTTDGGKTWQKVLYFDENTGAIQVEIDPSNSQIIYADLWAARQGPWENGRWQGPKSGLYKSTDGGNTWKTLTTGLPTFKQGLSRIGFCIAPSNHNRLYATVYADAAFGGIYKSEDAGETWAKLSSDKRLWDRGDDFAEIKADPKNADVVYAVNVVVWKSMDAGKTWTAIRGAPGGDDYHRLWINPDKTDIMLLAGDQGAVVTVNGGRTWSSWYNQPTAQLYHVSADNAFPYNVYGGQQESGSVGIASRGNDGGISFRDWHPVGVEEWGYAVADPLDPDIIYGGKLSRYDKRTGQVQDIAPSPVNKEGYRFIRTAPVVFSPVNPKLMFYAGNVLFKTYDGGHSWSVISPDLTRTTYDIPESVGVYKTEGMQTMPRRGVIYTIAPSPVDSNVIWVGTDDGLIQVTHNSGRSWDNVTPPQITSWSKISMMDASHTDANTVYVAVNRIRCDDMHPHIYKTNDGGKRWIEITTGLPADPVNVVREDTYRKGLLFAGSERAVYFSVDEGEHWQSLRLNMPATSIRDLVVKDNDLVVATHGRSFWILDDITPLRQLTAEMMAKSVILYGPSPAYRVRWNMNPDTPLPPDEPVAQNPPDGAVIDYYLKDKPLTLTLDIFDTYGKMVRHFSNFDTMHKIPDVNIPLYWIRPQQILSAEPGAHRFIWDLHYEPINEPATYPISAVYQNTAPVATSPWMTPGIYTIRLRAGNAEAVQSFYVVMDPRVKTSIEDLKRQYDLSMACYEQKKLMAQGTAALNNLLRQINLLLPQVNDTMRLRLKDMAIRIEGLQTTPAGSKDESLDAISESAESLFNILQAADVTPTIQCATAVDRLRIRFEQFGMKWDLVNADIGNINRDLQTAALPPLKIR